MIRDWCRVCEFPRYIEGYGGPADYIAHGWVRFVTTTTREDKDGVKQQYSMTEWLCPLCADRIEMDKQALMAIGSVKPPKTYNRRGVEVDERST